MVIASRHFTGSVDKMLLCVGLISFASYLKPQLLHLKAKKLPSKDAIQGRNASMFIQIQCQLHFLSPEMSSSDRFLKAA